MIRIVFSLDIARSNHLLSYLVILHGMMLITMVSLSTGFWWSIVACVLIGLSLRHYCQRHQWLQSTQSTVKIERMASGQWSLRYRDNRQSLGLTLVKSFVSPQIVILYFKGSKWWAHSSVTIVADAVDAELFRQLRVYCRDPKTFQQ